MLKHTPLFAAHQKLGARLIDFGGWEMPVQYTSIIEEHHAVRTAAGIFDISHMGEVIVRGPAAAAFLNATLTNDICKLSMGQGQYSLMCNEHGGVIDDLYVYRTVEKEYLLVINASRVEPDVAWLEQRLAVFQQRADVLLANLSDITAAVAVQGPQVSKFIAEVFSGAAISGTAANGVTALKKNQIGLFAFADQPVCWVGRTGYTGEDGFEVIAPASVIEAIWNRLIEVGQPFGLKPCGLGARDTLRTEACFSLYGHELDENTMPLEAGLGFFVTFDKGDFIGRAALLQQKEKGVSKKCVAFKMSGKSAPPRPHYPIWGTGADAKKLGEVTSGTQSPTLGIGIGLGYVPSEFAAPGTAIEIEIRGNRAPAIVVQKPFYKKAA
jgi:aminomethyltransferase